MILTPEQIKEETRRVQSRREYWGADNLELWKQRQGIPYVENDIVDTLVAYAEVVQKVAESDPVTPYWSYDCFCRYCGADWNAVEGEDQLVHDSDCLYREARKLLGKEAS